jgi:ribonuclease-3
MHPLLVFNDESLLLQALTHRSYVNENLDTPGHNERLEFLGDAILNFASGQYLYYLYPAMQEDELTRRRSALVDENQLAKFALEIGLDSKIRLGQGAILEGGAQNPNLLSSAFEAVVGAYYLDRDRRLEQLLPILEDLFDSVPEDIFLVRSNVDPKNQLQEFSQARGVITPPQYITKKVGGPDHDPEFRARVYVDDTLYGEGFGRSKKEAQKNAAIEALDKLID